VVADTADLCSPKDVTHHKIDYVDMQ
jgi:hypothetical protein